ncbi:hypothetical protein DFH29DRAFT_916160 [Suillus ampliporus]|nr:hypothetical protein DFH29DRAFT_916160 [Suillus ampliporus]
MLLPSPADSRLLETLYFERMRWETVVCVSQRDWPGLKFDTPQLRTLECTRSDVIKFNAPNLRRLHIVNQWLPDISPIPTCKNIRHLHLQSASPKIIHSTSVTFSFLETIVVDVITQYPGAGSDSGDSAPHSCLESMTLPLSSNPTHWHRFIEVFDGLYLPMLQKLTLVGDPNPGVVGRIMAALAVAVSCNVRVVDFQTDTPLDEVDLDTVEPLLSVVREVSVHEGLLCCRAPCN